MEIIPKVEIDWFEPVENLEGTHIQLEWLALYDPENNLLAKSDNKEVGSQHEVEWDDIIYVADKSGRILLDYRSLLTKFKDE